MPGIMLIGGIGIIGIGTLGTGGCGGGGCCFSVGATSVSLSESVKDQLAKVLH